MKLLRSFWEVWKRFGKKVGDLQARILLTLFYFVILAPFGLGMRAAVPRGWRRAAGSHGGVRARPPSPAGPRGRLPPSPRTPVGRRRGCLSAARGGGPAATR